MDIADPWWRDEPTPSTDAEAWYRGIEVYMTSDSLSGIHFDMNLDPKVALAQDMIAAFGRPVVPLVYMSMAIEFRFWPLRSESGCRIGFKDSMYDSKRLSKKMISSLRGVVIGISPDLAVDDDGSLP